MRSSPSGKPTYAHFVLVLCEPVFLSERVNARRSGRPGLGVLGEHPGNGFAVVGWHPVALRDGCGRARRAVDLPNTALRAYFSGAGPRANRGTFCRSSTHSLISFYGKSSRPGTPRQARRPLNPPEGMALRLPSKGQSMGRRPTGKSVGATRKSFFRVRRRARGHR